MRISLFDDEDLKSLETTIARALIRAIKTLAREGYIPGMTAPVPVPAEAAPVGADPPPVEVPAVPVEEVAPAVPPAPPAPVNGVAPSFLKPPPETPWRGKATEPAPEPPKPKKPRRSLRDVLQVVGDRPPGYIDTEAAQKMLNYREGTSSASATLSVWLMSGQVEGLIVANVKPPTKGYPGRLMVNADSLRAREKIRRENRTLPPARRISAPVAQRA